MSDLTFKQYQEAIRARNQYLPEMIHFNAHRNLSQLSNALAGECGELCNLIKKVERGDFGPMPEAVEEVRVMIGEELGDVVAYAAILADAIGLDLGEVTARKFNIKSDHFGVPQHKI